PAALMPFVESADIVELVGPASYQRAISYSKNGAVRDVDWDPATFRLVGLVQGTRSDPYRCRVELAPGKEGYCRIVASSCTCPMRFDCKHVAATLLWANEVFRRAAGF